MVQTAEQKREWYLANRDRHLERTRARHALKRDAVRVFLTNYLSTHPCIDCGEADPVVLDFDHVGVKTFGISTAVGNLKTVAKVSREIEQCVVRCANCHRRKTYATLGYRSRSAANAR